MSDPLRADRQDIRLAVVMNGGVSLGVWLGGVTAELHHLVMSCRGHRRLWPVYGQLLDLLGAVARVDVIAGTSAGGLNAAILALALARDRDLSFIRDLWYEQGGLDQLLRDPLSKNPPSLMAGDGYFLPRIREALAAVLGPAGHLPRDPGAPAPDSAAPVELILTGTLWQGRSSSFSDDMGTGITEVDHDATFLFASNPDGTAVGGPASGDLSRDGAVDELAVAVRCSSSFPGAFEPHWVDVHGPASGSDQRWESDAGLVNYGESQFLVDGGVLQGKPLRPALEAVYRQPGAAQVRRVLAYLVPHPGEASARPTGEGAHPDPPGTEEVLPGVLTRLRATDSVSSELAEIRARNQQAQSRRRARDRFAATMIDLAGPLSGQAWPGYRQVRLEYGTRTVGRLIAAGQPEEPGRWSESDLIGALSARELPFVPAAGGGAGEAVRRSGGDWDWGQSTVQRLGDMAADVLRRAVWLARPGSPERAAIVAARERLSGTLARVQADSRDVDAFWRAAPRGLAAAGVGRIPRREGGHNAPATNTAALSAWLGEACRGWERLADPAADPGQALRERREALHAQASTLAGHLRQAADAIRAVISDPQPQLDPGGEECGRLQALAGYLLAPQSAGQVLERMLRLDVVHVCFSGVAQEVEQEVELVQVSASCPGQLTGVQLHHFGAFYRGSWRVNDWLHGRMDGAAGLVRLLLSPQRLRQRGYAAAAAAGGGSRGEAASRLLSKIHAIAVPDAAPDRAWFEQQWARDQEACRAEAARVVTAAAPPEAGGPSAWPDLAMNACARAIARPIQAEILRADLPALAGAIRAEGEDATEAGKRWLRGYDSELAGGTVTAAALWRVWAEAGHIGTERIGADIGSDTFARVSTQVATVAAGMASSLTARKPAAAFLTAFRGYALALWAMVIMLTRKSHFGTRAVELTVAAGGVMVAVAIFVPGMPLAFILGGIVLLLAGLSAAALLSRKTRGIGWRLLTVAVLAAAAFSGYAYWDYDRHGTSATVWTLGIKIGIGLLVVLLGWWVARAHPRKRRHSHPGRKSDRARVPRRRRG